MNEYLESSVSVIIPVLNGGEAFRLCLESLRACSPSPHEVIVVADGESDGSWQISETFGYKVIVLDRSHGPAFARNRGAQAATGEILFFIDADVTVKSNAIHVVQQVFKDYPATSAVIGSYDDEPREKNFLSQFKNLIHHYVHQHSCQRASTFWGACGAIRSDVFHDMEGFDTTYRNPSIEDIELGYRLKEKEYPIRLEKTLFVKHLKRWEILSLLRADIFYRALPWSELIMKKDRLINDLNLTVSSRASVILVFLLLASLFLTTFSLNMIVFAGICCVLLMVLNRKVYRFFLQKRGKIFTMKAVFWHWLYFLYSGVAFAYVFGKTKLLSLFNQ